ncbi:UvrD-helicase domain-containing protein [Kaistella antarctica]|uniref:DNA 3'-5' helicase n=1 Tax=Kaistella antarctica TaxID=266748 RepID=A0A3S4VF66_9FLAO|nr:UvrD-helicase domain-containing protein [Kaistella antarctica]KEY18685.1 helicase UvrD [Kaistella antarctica]SEW16657.1 ATP-dependent exoDNAse (exonuclease V) beta subunit (contains helicase and exonuclease domains) [Kaistella antarctica]VEH99725.1 Exodeoxyribonuclease V beta chain [Kaistella antarctica]
MQPDYKVINASAGSGKTYALVQNLLAICLKYPSQADKIRTILALTFTNKAANEMKHRIIDWLKKFSLETYETNNDLINIQEKLKNEGFNIPLKDLHERSKKMLDYVLHHYSTLNIGTIDKFNAKLVRSFAQELGLAQNFNLEINPEPFLIEAVDKMLEDIGEDNIISEAFMDFVNYTLDNNDRIDLNKTLYYSAKEYVQDKHYFQLNTNKDFDWEVYERTKKTLRKSIKDLREDSIKTAEEVMNLLQEKDLEVGDFFSGANGIGGFFEKFLKTKLPKLYLTQDEEDKRDEKNCKGCSSKAKHKQSEILEILDYLRDHRKRIITNHVEAEKKEKILNALLPLKVNKDIQDKLAEIEQENDLVLLSKFNIMIHENLREEPTAFIYEKIGTKFSHYFFDEFQDTSLLQWQNFLPLRDHAISQEHMSFTLVGDPKQSIYRFRGGNSQLMLDIINHKGQSSIPAKVENLGNNYRSAKNIVDFNNQLYEYMSQFTEEEHQEIFGKGSHQTAKSEMEGRVRINLIENASKKSLYYENASTKMRDDIESCLANGFRFSDITILCRGNFDIFTFSQLLGNLKVNYRGEEVYIKTISESGLTLNLSLTLLALTEFLKWEENPKNLQFPVKMLYYLKVLGRIEMEDFSNEIMELLTLKTKSEIEVSIAEKYGLQLQSKDLLQLNLYNFIEHFLHEFAVKDKETDFLFNYLEMIYAYSQNAGSTLKEFLKYWAEEANKKTIQASENVDAIQIMTIHKSKGLEFPVVLLPMKNAAGSKKSSYWFGTNTEEQLNSVNVNFFDTSLEIYDPEIAGFNSENSYQEKIDQFCLQYVATTRAAEQLFFYIEMPNKTSNHLEIYDYLEPKIPRDETGEPNLSFDLYEVTAYDLKKKSKIKSTEFTTKAIYLTSEKDKYPNAIKIATPTKSYQNRVEKVRMGIFTHEILARINTAKDVEKVLESYLLEGTITNDEQLQISDRIFDIINNENYSKYFTENQVVINEKDIMISENGTSSIYRPDRLIETEDGIIIIDFKTGDEQEKHQRQLDEYQSVLEKLGKKVIESQIVYV